MVLQETQMKEEPQEMKNTESHLLVRGDWGKKIEETRNNNFKMCG
jgi:hypothetical protein